MFNYIHRIDGATVNEVLIHNLTFTEVGENITVRNRLNGCVTVIYRSVSTYKQARSQEVRRGGSINTSESIYPGGQIRERGGGKSVPSRLAGQIRKARHLRA